MADAETLLADVIALAGGQIVGRVRLQKTVYLLDRLGLGSGFDYEYHYYGPYSESLALTLDFADPDTIQEENLHRTRDGLPYSIYKSKRDVPSKNIGSLDRETVDRSLRVMQQHSATVLELAATIDWLINTEHISDWRSELHLRKGAKAAGGRTEEALAVLKELDLLKT